MSTKIQQKVVKQNLKKKRSVMMQKMFRIMKQETVKISSLIWRPFIVIIKIQKKIKIMTFLVETLYFMTPLQMILMNLRQLSKP